MKTAVIFAGLLLVLSAEGGRKEPAVLDADVFQLIRIDQDQFGLAWGVFTFRHHHTRELTVWGGNPPARETFTPHSVRYEFRTQAGWEQLRLAGCGTGIGRHILRPGVDYVLRVGFYHYYHAPIFQSPQSSFNSVGKDLRIAMDSSEGVFHSAVFRYPGDDPAHHKKPTE